MKKNNKKGFILVETLVVTVFVVTLFVFIYRITLPSIGEYEQLNQYDDIDSIYYSNLYKQMITRYADITKIDEYLNTPGADHTYLNISDCSDWNIFKEKEYCQLLKDSLGITSTDVVLLTKYNIKDFKETVKSRAYDDVFDSGTLSNFRDYIKTVPNHEVFYNSIKDSDFIGKYRLFLVRSIENNDETHSKRYVNIGIYTGNYKKLLAGDQVEYDTGDGERYFYVLKNSPSTDSQVTLISMSNVDDGICFNTDKKVSAPNVALAALKEATKNWTNVPYLTGYKYSSGDYTINYNGYRARLLEPNDIIEALGCKEDLTTTEGNTCFEKDDAFEVEFDKNAINFLANATGTDFGYWTAHVIHNSYWEPTNDSGAAEDNFAEYHDSISGNYYSLAWAVTEGKIKPVGTNDCTNIGIRPVITVDKADVKEVSLK